MFADDKINVLLIEDEYFDVERIKKTIKFIEANIKIKDVVSDGSEAIKLIQDGPHTYDVIIMDYQISGGILGEKLIKKIKEIEQL